jgi:hypothetical protein
MFPVEWTTTIAVYHLGTGAGKQTYTLDPSVKSGSFLPMDSKQFQLEGGDFRDPHELYVGAEDDVRASDKVVIDGTDYFVRHVFNGRAGGLAHKRCVLSSKA